MSQQPFTQELWKAISSIYNAIRAHLFIKGLVDGSLKEETFKLYVIQDALYLSEFARALSIAAAKAPKDEWLITFNEHSRTAIEVERALHQSFFRDWGLTERDVYSTPMTPTNLAYTSYLIAVSYSKPFHELLGALLPCYWIYWEVGKELERQGSKRDLYRRWIETYSSESFAEACRAVLDMMDSLVDRLGQDQRDAVKRHFIITSRYEYMFWDSAYRRERWPV